MLIIGIDPGGTTGVVLLEPSEKHIHIDHSMHGSWVPTTEWLADELSNFGYGGHAVAIEQFTIAPRTLSGTRAGSLETLYTIGAVRYLCYKAEVALTFQGPASAKNAFTDERLKELGLWDRVSGDHERDALRHALLLARTMRLWRGVVAA